MIDRARQELDAARTMDDIKRIRDKAEAVRTYIRLTGASLEAQNYAAEIKIRAERRAGELLAEMKANGDRKGQSGKQKFHDETSLADLGISKLLSHRWQAEALVSKSDFEAHLARINAAGKELTSADVYRMGREIASRERRSEILASTPEPVKRAGLDLDTISLCAIADLALPAECADMVFTDPPYHDEYLGLFDSLADLACHVLKPGAFLMTYCGKMFLPQVVASLGRRLEYVWTFCVFQPDGSQKVNKHNLFEAWRPILCYRKPGDTIERAWQPDAIRATRDKSFHEWQQQIEPPLKYIEAYTPAGGVVIDPFIGGGTTAVACRQIGRHYVGFDVDPEAVRMTTARLENG
jgi:hypothetical protein